MRFEAPRNAIVLPVSLRASRSPVADPDTWASSLPALEAQARRIEGLDFTAARVEMLLHQAGTRRLASPTCRAEALLREGSRSVAEIGYRLGYEDAANFARACRRWFGAAPSALRRGSDAPS